jgi:hypothetical protein
MRVSGATLCPLGQPKKAIGHEPLIGPWLATLRPSRLVQFREPNRPITIAGSPRRRKPIAPLRTEKQTGIARPSRGLDAAKTVLAPGSGRSVFRLTSPFIGHSDNVTSWDLDCCSRNELRRWVTGTPPVTQIYIKPSSNQRSTTSREASAARRLRPNGVLGDWVFTVERLTLLCYPAG